MLFLFMNFRGGVGICRFRHNRRRSVPGMRTAGSALLRAGGRAIAVCDGRRVCVLFAVGDSSGTVEEGRSSMSELCTVALHGGSDRRNGR